MQLLHIPLPVTHPDGHHHPDCPDATLVCYLQHESEEIPTSHKRPAVILAPGGGYFFRSDREAEPVALSFAAAGVQVFVLEYSVAPSRFPCALLELAQAVHLVRTHSTAWCVDPERIFLCGFSAGAHLCASLGTLWNHDFLSALSGLSPKELRPNGLILCYPVITMGQFTHESSRELLFGDLRSPELDKLLSAELQVSDDTPPAFLWHTVSDDTVPVENSLLFASALRRHGVSFELHLYESGNHGLSLANRQLAAEPWQYQPQLTGWFHLVLQWMERH